MAKSLRSKREKRLRTLRREIVEPFYEKKDIAKLAAQEAALAAPKLPVRTRNGEGDDMVAEPTALGSTGMDVEMADGGSSFNSGSLKPAGGVGKKMKKKLWKVGKSKRRGKGKFQKKHKF